MADPVAESAGDRIGENLRAHKYRGDATGIRRQAGKHARLLNKMIEDLAAGHPLKEELLLEFLGHTPLEALAGTLLGIACAQVGWMIFH